MVCLTDIKVVNELV